jgi:hypothetical protein
MLDDDDDELAAGSDYAAAAAAGAAWVPDKPVMDWAQAGDEGGFSGAPVACSEVDWLSRLSQVRGA